MFVQGLHKKIAGLGSCLAIFCMCVDSTVEQGSDTPLSEKSSLTEANNKGVSVTTVSVTGTGSGLLKLSESDANFTNLTCSIT